jgi:hypothetical protein
MVFGENTPGSIEAATSYYLPDGSEVFIETTSFVLPNGDDVGATGVVPMWSSRRVGMRSCRIMIPSLTKPSNTWTNSNEKDPCFFS